MNHEKRPKKGPRRTLRGNPLEAWNTNNSTKPPKPPNFIRKEIQKRVKNKKIRALVAEIKARMAKDGEKVPRKFTEEEIGALLKKYNLVSQQRK